jgi:type II secretory pathway pseudopilin PulG
MNLGQNSSKRMTHAFTLVDVMMGMAVLGFVLTSLFAAFSFGFNVVKVSREDLQATQILQEKMEVIRLYTWDQITNSAYIPTNFVGSFSTNGSAYFKGTVKITTPVLDVNDGAAYSSDLREVTVSLSWTNHNVKRIRETRTYVSRNGVQNYVLQ